MPCVFLKPKIKPREPTNTTKDEHIMERAAEGAGRGSEQNKRKSTAFQGESP